MSSTGRVFKRERGVERVVELVEHKVDPSHEVNKSKALMPKTLLYIYTYMSLGQAPTMTCP